VIKINARESRGSLNPASFVREMLRRDSRFAHTTAIRPISLRKSSENAHSLSLILGPSKCGMKRTDHKIKPGKGGWLQIGLSLRREIDLGRSQNDEVNGLFSQDRVDAGDFFPLIK
jgi:hypothetical protein